MHEASLDFFRYIVNNLPEWFEGNIKVLDVGSGDINGNLRKAFIPGVKYLGNDVYPGKNVDIVSPTHELPFFSPTFNTIVSSECFELDPDYTKSFKKIVEILKPGGLFVFTCASTGRPEYGTKKTTPFESLAAKSGLSKYKNYYKNITFEDISNSINLDAVFSQYAAYYNNSHKDLYFYGIKKGLKDNKIYNIPNYEDKYVEKIKIIPEPVEKTVAENTVEEVAEKVAENTVEEVAEKTVAEKTVEEVVENTVEEVVENTVEEVAEKTVEEVTENTVEEVAENTVEEVAENTVIKSIFEEVAENTVIKSIFEEVAENTENLNKIL